MEVREFVGRFGGWGQGVIKFLTDLVFCFLVRHGQSESLQLSVQGATRQLQLGAARLSLIQSCTQVLFVLLQFRLIRLQPGHLLLSTKQKVCHAQHIFLPSFTGVPWLAPPFSSNTSAYCQLLLSRKWNTCHTLHIMYSHALLSSLLFSLATFSWAENETSITLCTFFTVIHMTSLAPPFCSYYGISLFPDSPKQKVKHLSHPAHRLLSCSPIFSSACSHLLLSRKWNIYHILHICSHSLDSPSSSLLFISLYTAIFS